MTYTLKMNPRLVLPGRQLKHVGNGLVAFYYGVATGVPEEIAEAAGAYRFISEIIPEEIPVEEDPEVETTPEGGTPEDTDHEGDVPEDVVSEEVETEEDTPEEEGPSVTAEDISRLYEEHKTWKAVALHLGLTTAQLRDLRRELGVD